MDLNEVKNKSIPAAMACLCGILNLPGKKELKEHPLYLRTLYVLGFFEKLPLEHYLMELPIGFRIH
jgi:hypothetical protein